MEPNKKRRTVNAALAGALLTAWLTPHLASATAATKTIVVLGDSLSAEYGLERGSGWVAKLEEQLGAQKPEYQIYNSSISGDTTSGGLSRLPALLDARKPAIVVIELGGNDALRGLSLDMTRGNLERMIDASRGAGAQVLLVGMQIPPNYGKRYTQEFSKLYGELAKEKEVALVPFLLEKVATNRDYFQDDGIHPNALAQPLLADTVWPYLEPLL